MKFTASQQKVIDLRGKNILVSAAAGSGKTAVLVERIIGRITDPDHPADIDRLLIVTFTNAAAGEMKERIAMAIEKKLEENPEDENLQRQATLIHHAQITTIDSFCLFLIKNHFNEIGLDPGFRVADPGEIKLIMQDSMNEILEEGFQKEESAEKFRLLFDSLAFRGKEKILEETILKIFQFSESFPWPEEWLEERYYDYQTEEGKEWHIILRSFFKEQLGHIKATLQLAMKICTKEDGPYMYLSALQSDQELIEKIETSEWNTIYEILEHLSFSRISTKKDPAVSEEKKELVKELRDRIKKDLGKLKEEFFPFSPEIMKMQMKETSQILNSLIDAVLLFRERFRAKKREKNILDFSDMEHLALEILITRERKLDRDGKPGFLPTKTALEYREYFREIMVDEYQDSNLVQEYLLQSIAGETPNRFMVGDLKQSIYKFRLARPEIFLEKYETYSENEEEENCRIDLHKNFRSRSEVIESVNDVFYQIMGKDLGKVEYTEKEALFFGAQYPDCGEDYGTEILLLEETEEDARQAEAAMAARKIKSMVDRFLVTDKATGEIRKAAYSDFVILLRTNAGWDEVFYQVFTEQGIPAAVTNKTGYFSAVEVQTVLNFLRVLDNPLQDIPLYGTMKSLFGGFTEEEIVAIKREKKKSLYENLKMQEEEKAVLFLKRLEEYRDLVALLPLHKLLRKYLEETGYYYYYMALPGGQQRAANLKMLLEKAESYEKTSYFGLFHFIRYMEQLQKYDIDEPEAGITNEAADVVRIMSIHKSKGLEFPICFLCGLSKKINQRDAQEGLICDMDLGIGMEYRNPVKRIRRGDIRRNVLAGKIRRDNLGEELRILYVAMTRAKEKLIMTGTIKDFEQKMRTLEHLKMQEEEKLPGYILFHASSYLDLILAASIRKGKNLRIFLENPFEINTILLEKEVKNVLQRAELEYRMSYMENKEVLEGKKEKFRENFNFLYHHGDLEGLYAKTSVSELKMKAMEEKDEEAYQLFELPEITEYLPAFIEEKEEISGVRRGNAYHRIMELMNFDPLPAVEELFYSMKQLEEEKILDPAYLPLIRKKKMEAFLNSDLAKRMAKAAEKKKLFREQPFVLGISANQIEKRFPEEEKVLIQGIIDAFFEEEGELVVIDYKTDRIKTPEELISRYEEQLKYYADALEQVTGKRVKEQLIYSFALDQVLICFPKNS